MLVAVRKYEREGTGLACPLPPDCVAGIVVDPRHRVGPQEPHQPGPRERPIPEQGPGLLHGAGLEVRSGPVVQIVFADCDGREENAALVSHGDLAVMIILMTLRQTSPGDWCSWLDIC